MQFVYPKLSKYAVGSLRIGGPGMGNLLFVYARALIYARKYQLKLIAPTWGSFKIGPLLRGESDKRLYLNIFNTSGIYGLKKLFLLLTCSKQLENEFISRPQQTRSILIVSGLGNYFDDFKYENEYIKKNLLHICKRPIISAYQQYNPKTIAVHVRLGDYPNKNRISIGWYVEKINLLRSLGYHYPVIIFSDGKDSELKSILTLPNTTRVNAPNALADILRMSKAEVLIGSDSTFSTWAAFLGRNHFIRKDNFYLNKIYHQNDRAYEGALSTDDDIKCFLRLKH
jgi:hypothetical protein